ncbi:MAG: hypothetical protein R2834_12410 [Rhodothermales bacterium]
MTDPLDRLARVLAQLVSDAGFALLCDADDAVQHHCVRQYNQVLAQVRKLEPDLTAGFAPLDLSAGAGVVRMRGRDLLVQLSSTRSSDWLGAWLDRIFSPGDRLVCC